MLISEELFLLATKENGVVDPRIQNGNYALNGALLADLLTAGIIEATDSRKDANLTETSAGSTDHPLLRDARHALAPHLPARASQIVKSSWLSARESIGRSLGADGLVLVEGPRMLGLGQQRFPIVDMDAKKLVIARLGDVLRGEELASSNDAVLLLILQQTNAIHSTLLSEELRGMRSRDVRTRIQDITRSTGGSVATGAVQRALDGLVAVLGGSAATMM